MSLLEVPHLDPEPSRADIPAYAAVPFYLRFDTEDIERRSRYYTESLARIRSGLLNAVRLATNEGWIEPGGLRKDVRSLIDLSLTQSHEKRLMLNRQLDTDIDLSDERVQLAGEGHASPADLLSLLADYPILRSIELAKLSHPLDFDATLPMDEAVADAIEKEGGEHYFGTVRRQPSYKPKTRREHLPAMTVLRKQPVGLLRLGSEAIQIVSRQAYLVRGDRDAVHEEPYLDRKVRNPDRFNEVAEIVENSLDVLETDPRLKHVQPIATSYYAKYIPNDSLPHA